MCKINKIYFFIFIMIFSIKTMATDILDFKTLNAEINKVTEASNSNQTAQAFSELMSSLQQSKQNIAKMNDSDHRKHIPIYLNIIELQIHLEQIHFTKTGICDRKKSASNINAPFMGLEDLKKSPVKADFLRLFKAVCP